jgi:AraC family transcriptional regulator
MAGIPLSEYIRRRRMSLAAVDLQAGDNKVIDVALKYGYDSPTAFNRAFQGIPGISPSKAKEEGITLIAYPPIRFQITIKGVSAMNFRIEKKEAFRILGVSEALETDLEKNFMTVPNMWGTAAANGTIAKLVERMDGTLLALLGVSSCNEMSQWRYYIGVESSKQAEDNLEEFTVKEATWAVFPGEGTNMSIQELERRIVTEWLPTSGYEYGNAPDIEVYLNADPENAKYEVWIPVVKKGE